MKKYKERRLYYFTCAGCGHKATSFKRRRVKAEHCRNCRRVLPTDPNQMMLFSNIEDSPEHSGEILKKFDDAGIVVN